MVRVAIALGSNLGDRAAHLARGVSAIRQFVPDLIVSPSFETEPVGAGPQPRYLNAAAAGHCDRSAADLLARLLAIEAREGRTRPAPLAPRTLDLDLILFGDAVIDTPAVTVPHPRFRDRAFVLEPLALVAPDMRDPVSGLTVGGLWQRLREAGACA